MSATLTAVPNPVGIWTASGTANIAWNTGGAAPGRVYLSVATSAMSPPETLFDGDPSIGGLSGAKALTVVAGSTYTLTLRQVSNNAVLATRVVTVEDLWQILVAEAAANAALAARVGTQTIYALQVQAGIDDVRVTFSTTQPTIPVVRADTLDGTEVAVSFPLLDGLVTGHQVLLGQNTPLPQATEFKLTIIAAGRNFFGGPHEAVATTAFTTGSRQATLTFDQIEVFRQVGNSFTFTFGAGDAYLGTDMGEPWPVYQGDISADGPPARIREQITIPFAPRNLWVEVIGTQDDGSLGLSLSGEKPTFTGAGTNSQSGDNTDQSWVTNVYDIANVANGTNITMDLMTGDFDVMFEVLGQLNVATTPGTSPISQVPPNIFRTSVTKVSVLAAAGGKAGLRPAGGDGAASGFVLVRAPDGAAYRRTANAGQKLGRNEGWVAVTPAVTGPVTAVALAEDRLALFALDTGGAVLRADAVGNRPAREWRTLGGRFTGVLTAVAPAESIELLAQDPDGAIYHLTAPERAGGSDSAGSDFDSAGLGNSASDWQRIGEGVPGALSALSFGKNTCAIFALATKGGVMHRIHSLGKWRPEGWQTIPGPSGVQLGAAWREGQGVALVLIDAQFKLHVLVWRGFPESAPPSWVSEGDLQSWLVRPTKRPPSPQP